MGIKLAVVGSGYWGSKVVAALEKNRSVGKLQVIDIRNGQTIDDIDSDVTAAIIATPLWDHFDTATKLLERGLDCYIEKPMAETAEQCKTLSGYARDRIVMVGHIFLYHPALQVVKDAMSQIGNVTLVKSERLNWGIYQTKTTPLLSLLPHDISIVQELLKGSIVVQSAKQMTFTNNIVPDYINFSGRVGNISVDITGSWYWPERVRKLTVIGDKGHIVWDDNQNKVYVYSGEVKERRLTELNMATVQPDESLTPLEHELNHFIDCVVTRATPHSDCNNAIDVALTIDEVNSLLAV
jgi:predicted dehydrogenase